MANFSYRVKLTNFLSDETQTITVISAKPIISTYSMQQLVDTLLELDFANPVVEDFRLEV